MIYGGNAIWNKYVLSFFQKEALVSDDFKVMRSSFQTLGAEKAFAQVKISFSNIVKYIMHLNMIIMLQKMVYYYFKIWTPPTPWCVLGLAL